MFDLIKYLNENRLSQTARLADRAKKTLNEDYNPEIPDSDQPIGSSDKTSSRVGSIQSKLAMLKRKKDELVQKFTSGQIDIQQYKTMIGNIPQEIKKLQADLDRDTMQIGDDEDDMNEEMGEKKSLGEVDIDPASEIGQAVKRLSELDKNIVILENQLKALQGQYSDLEKPVYSILKDLNTLEGDIDRTIKVGEDFIVKFQTKPTTIVNYKYKEAFLLLESKVNGAIRTLVNEVKEANKSVSDRRGKISVTPLKEADINVSEFDALATGFKDEVNSINRILNKLTGGIA
jgi:chromosome segregation ATPase